MNIKTLSGKINRYINLFKNRTTSVFTGRDLPKSYETLSEDEWFNLGREACVRNMITSLNKIPSYTLLKSKNKSVTEKELGLSFRIYPNRRLETFKFRDNPSLGEIPLCVSLDDGTLVDARVRGGGLKKAYIKDLAGNNLFFGSFADIGRYDGTPINTSSTVVIELPKDTEQKFKSVIENIVKKYLAAGVLPVIRYYEAGTLETLGWDFEAAKTAPLLDFKEIPGARIVIDPYRQLSLGVPQNISDFSKHSLTGLMQGGMAGSQAANQFYFDVQSGQYIEFSNLPITALSDFILFGWIKLDASKPASILSGPGFDFYYDTTLGLCLNLEHTEFSFAGEELPQGWLFYSVAAERNGLLSCYLNLDLYGTPRDISQLHLTSLGSEDNSTLDVMPNEETSSYLGISGMCLYNGEGSPISLPENYMDFLRKIYNETKKFYYLKD